MARNSEKRLSGLNRFLEAKETEKNSKLQRPPLCRLGTAEEVKGWIPSIQKEISYLLMQIEGTGSRKHNDSKIKEFQDRIEYLQREHTRFVDKVRNLDPAYSDVMPWQPRAYSRKRGRGGGEEGKGQGVKGEVNEPQTKKLFSPLLAKEENSRKKPVASQSHSTDSQEHNFLLGSCRPNGAAHSNQPNQDSVSSSDNTESVSSEGRRGLLGLEYSSSSSDDDAV